MTTGTPLTRMFPNLEGKTVSLKPSTDSEIEVMLAHPLHRVTAKIIDRAILSPLFIIAPILVLVSQHPAVLFVAATVVLAADYFYECNMLGDSGQTVGRRLVGICVIDIHNAKTASDAAMSKRWMLPVAPYILPLLLLVLAWALAHNAELEDSRLGGAFILGLSAIFLWFVAFVASTLIQIASVWDDKSQGWHDRLAGTLVIKGKLGALQQSMRSGSKNADAVDES